MAHMQPTVHLLALPDARSADLAAETRLRLRQLIDSLPDIPARLRVMGHGLLDVGQVDLALNCFGRALLADDLDDATHLGLVRTYLQKGNRDQAMAHLEIAISLRPEMRDLRVILADLLCDRHHLRSALDQLAQVLADEPTHAGARRGLANILQNFVAAGHVNSATPDVSKAVPLNDTEYVVSGADSEKNHTGPVSGVMVWNIETAFVPQNGQPAPHAWYWCEPFHPAIS
ncbi:hypothetical protein J4E05_05600 [Thalassospira sp. NFXS8]|uniref:tetratricopeptide repeat protein n=1 Tax=Thalassospira sp. NFXS8 TaxID=2819093 RepID=UPI0032DE9608